MAMQMAFAAKITVTNTSDDEKEEGSLRWACAKGTAKDTIVFGFNDKAVDNKRVINISRFLETSASIDGSTCPDSIIINGPSKSNSSSNDGFELSGSFMKNIVVQNCAMGFHVTSSSSTIVFDNCIARDCYQGFYCLNGGDIRISHCKTLNNTSYGISSGSAILIIEDCDIIGNKNDGIYGQAMSIKKCIIRNNQGNGINVTYAPEMIIDSCVISGNTKSGINTSGNIKRISNNIIGLTEDQKNVLPNEVGVSIQGTISDFMNNVVSGNTKDGIYSNGKSYDIENFSGNYIGTNEFFDDDPMFGNGGNGYTPGYRSAPKFSKNYFGNNGGSGIKASYSGIVFDDCYFGITPDGKPIPNGESGLSGSFSNTTFNNCHFGYNKKSGIYLQSGNITINGGEFVKNEVDGISFLSIGDFSVKDASFDSNTNTAISFALSGSKSLVSNSKFLNTPNGNLAIKSGKPEVAPEITSCKITDKTVEITGKVDTTAEAKIELFYTSQGEQTAEMLVDSMYTEKDGTFSFSIDKTKLKGKSILGFTATATYSKTKTSPLSKVVYPEMPKVDLTRTEFYVKEDGYGDGSSWSKAMSPQSFAYYIGQVKDGTTFHVAKGEYTPKYGRGLEETNDPNKLCYEINSKVIIIGGYSSYASNESEQSNPDRYQTIFNGDIKHNDKIVYEEDGFFYFDNSEDNLSNMFIQNADLELRGILFKGCYNRNYGCPAILMNKDNLRLNVATSSFINGNTSIKGSYESTIKIDSCRFINGSGNYGYAGGIENKASLVLKNCFFDECCTLTSGGAVNSVAGTSIDIENVTFNRCYAYNGSVIYMGMGGVLRSVNSTYVNNLNRNVFYVPGSDVELYNNTFLSNQESIFFSGIKSLKMTGNVFEKFIDFFDKDKMSLSYNIFVNAEGVSYGEESFSMSPLDISKCFEGTYDSENEKFIATLSEDEEKYGFTPTVAVKSDKLGDKSIRFPRLKDVLTDQRGVARPKSTCIGAYEPECKDVEYSAVDSVFVGEEKYGVTFDKLGIYEGISYKYISSTGCDSVVNYKIFARPKSSIKTYYVKTNGDGDGSSWDKALSPADFDFVLKTLTTDNVTFYLAKGIYHAHYDYKFNYLEESDKNCVWKTYHPVTIIGGFPANSTGLVKSTDVPNGKINPTILSGDVDDNDELVLDDCSYSITNQDKNVTGSLFSFDLYKNPGTITLSNLVFSGIRATTGYAYGVNIISSNENKDKISANISQCEFTMSYFGLNGNQVSNMTVDGCEFNYIKDLGLATSDYCKVTNSTFKHCYRAISSYDAKSCNVVNSTFVNNLQDFDCNAEITEFYNNTFVSCTESYLNSLIYSDKSNYFYGNIFAGSRLSLNNNGSDGGKLDIANNVIAADFGTITLGKGNIKVDPNTLFDGILDVVYSQKNGIEGINLSTKNGSTPVVALLKDELPTGEKIRFDRLDGVTKDQCGVERLDSTCMGACELLCKTDTVLQIDTIYAGTKPAFKDSVYNNAGRYDNIYEVVTEGDCESVINHTLIVLLNPKSLNYYVKTERWNDGDGRDWDNAMSGEDFAAALPLAPNGATFYVAAGTYRPSSKEKRYVNTQSSDISIIGGFAPEPQKNDKPEPETYKTIFSADISNDDKVSFIRTKDGVDSVAFDSREDNLSIILSLGSSKNTLSNSRLSGIVFDGATEKAVSLIGDYTVDHCEFRNNENGLHLGIPVNLILSESYFYNNKMGYVKYSNGLDVTDEKIESCTFERNYSSVCHLGKERLKIYNSTFYDNGFFQFNESQELLLKNNTIVGPYLFKATNTTTTTNKWNLLGNIINVKNYVKDDFTTCSDGRPSIGTGTLSDPYKISSANELLWFSKLVSEGTVCEEMNPSACAYLSKDIDLKNICGEGKGNWMPITNYSGTFDGTGHVVRGLYYESEIDDYAGLFGVIKNGAVVKNIIVSGHLINNGAVGGVVGAASNSTIINCKNNALVQSTEKFAGGVVGYANSSTVDRCCNLGMIVDTSGNTAKAGGICGATYGISTINNCYNIGDVISTSRAGGIVGSVDGGNTSISNSYNYGLISCDRNGDPIYGIKGKSEAVCSISNTYSLIQSKWPNVSVLSKEEFADGTLLSKLSKNNVGVWGSGYNYPVLATPEYSKYEGGTRVPERELISILDNNLWKCSIASKYNLLNMTSFGDDWEYDESDIVYSNADWTSFIDGVIDENLFVANLSDNGGFTKTIALLMDTLPTGQLIRFDRLDDVTKDQRGESRLDLTCMGAYELFSGRDTVYVYTNDTVCLGSNYERNGWSLLTEDLAEGEYKYGRFLKGKVATDTIDTLVLHVNPYNKIMVEPTVTPTLCHGDGYGEVTFNPYSFVSGSAIVNVMNDNGDILFSDAQNFNSVYNNNKLEIGKYGISIKSQTQCVLDTLINIEVIDRESLKSVGDLEDMITECANEPTSEVKISLTGFHPSMKFYHNGEEITSQTENDKLVYSADAAVTAKASLSMSKIAVGKHSITAVDACENTFELGEFNVIVPENQIVDMKLVDYTKKPLSCGLDSGYAQFNITSGAASTFYLKSDLGYSYTLSLQAEDTLLKLSDLTKGNYQALLKKNSATCSDTSFAEFPITSPEPLSLSLTSNGAACAEGSVMADAAGGTGVLTYHWTDPTGKKFDTESSKLEEASAGTYKCVVEDATHCFSHTDSIDILPNVENLFELHVSEPVIKNITCFDLENGTIEIPFSTENAQQAVALVVTNTKTGKETKTSGTYASTNGLLAIRTLAKGSYSYEVYYGTESCRLDTNSVKGTFKISAKETPFEMLPLSVYKEQTCLNPSNGSIVDTVIGWENDYKAYLITEQGNKYNVKPTVENGVTKLYADLLSGGFYYYKVEDACGSVMKTEAVNLTKYSPLSITVTSFTDSVTCAKSKDAEIKFFITGGIGTNHMAYVDDKSYTKKGSIVSKDNGQGYHDVYYKSTIAGCKDSVGERIRIAGPDTLEIKYTLTGNCPGSALIPEVSGESGEYTYLWSDGSREIDGTEEFPFDDMEAGETYSLTVSDVKCDYGYTKSFRIPTADELPTISQVVVAESEKCHNGNNGKIIVKPTLSKKMDFALTATIFYHKVGSKDSIPYSCVLDPDAVYTTPENLEPGDYRVTTRLGTMDCDMGVNPATVVKTVDPLPSLEIKSKIAVTDQTCKTPNGTATFTVEGWTYTHTAKLYYYPLGISLVYLNKDITPTSVDENYVATFELNSLSFGTYKIMVRDICDNKDESDKFKIVYKPTKIKNITTKKSTCINEPNGVMEFDIEGWTSLHNCDLVKDDNAQAGYFDDVQPVSYDETTKKAHFSVNTLSAGNWRIWVKNECDESWCLDTFNVVEGITEYHIGHINKLTTTMLDCPYSEDGEIGIAYYGGYNPGELVATVNSTVPVYKQTGYETKVVERFETIKVGKMVYDSTKCDTTYITDVVGAAKDTVVTMYVNCPPMVDPETGEFVVDSIEYNVTVYDTITVPVYGYVDSTTYDTMNARNPIPYKRLPLEYRVVSKFLDINNNIFTDLGVGTYVFRYKSTVEGCSDMATDTVRIRRPDPVHIVKQVLDISCATSTDGQVSIKPLRGQTTLPEKPQYVVSHDTSGLYQFNNVYSFSTDSISNQYGTVPSNNHKLLIDADGNPVKHRIDVVNDQSDFKSITWSYAKKKTDSWKKLDLTMPTSVDSTEQFFFNSNKDTIKSAVYSNFHLDNFWIDYNGVYQYSDVQSIANLSSGYYAVEVTDSKSCVYHDTFRISLPETALQIVSIDFDEEKAKCDPKQRQIHVDVKGGWGKYVYSFTDMSSLNKPMSTKSNGYRGGEAAHYDSVAVTGWCDSKFLEPGEYVINVMDEKGCVVSSEKKYKVQSTFDLKSDTVYAICPRDKFTDTEVYFYNQTPSGKYNVYSLESKCSTELLDDCTDKSYKPLLESYDPKTNDKGKYSFPITLSTATHGIFVYEDKEKGCGTYVESTVEDTLIPMEISMKRDVVASLISKCYDSNDAVAEFFIDGGTPDYKIVRNPEWGSREIMEIDGEPQIFTPELKTIEYKSKNSVGEDTVIEKRYVSIPGLMSGTHYLSVIDAIGCVRPFGGDVIDSVVVKKPAPLKVDFATSMVCPVTSITTGGNIFFNKVSGGTPPYSYSYSFDNGKVYDCNPIQEIPEGKLHKPVYMALTDANGCVKDTITEFVDDDFMVENVDFWASTKRYKGDVLALIDNCEPAEHLDSVVFTFTNPITGEVDSRIETLDKRMYIYDIESGAEKYKMALKGSKNTKTEVSDAYFKNHFNLLVDENLAKHISFIRMNDTTGAWTTSMNNQDSVWVMHNVKMTAYLKGCAYETEYRELKVNYDNIEIYDGGLPRGGDILSMTVTPNPCVDFSLTKMKATFAKKMDADLYIYHMNGTSEAHYHISASDPNWTDATKYDDASFEISLDKVLSGNGSNMDGVYSEVMVVYLKTSRDAKSTHIIVDPKLLDK